MVPDRMAIRAFHHLVAERLGLEFPEARHADFRKALHATLGAQGLPTLEALYEALEDQDLESAVWHFLREQVTINETYFFRDPGQLDVVREHILLPLARSGRPRKVRLWSAGCASGEEAYTLAFIAREALPEALGWQVDVLGTDLHPSGLERARNACYREWSFRGVQPALQDKWFQKTRHGWLVVPEVRSMVRFKSHNLAGGAFEALADGEGFDLILCRNVLIYFKEESRRGTLGHFLKALKAGGALVTGHNELQPSDADGLRVEHYADSLVVWNGRRPSPASPAPAPRVALAPPAPHPARTPNPDRAAASSAVKREDPLEGARAALARGDHGKALELARKLAGVEAIQVAGQALANLGRGEEAMALVAEGVARQPTAARLHYLYALLAFEQGQDAAALRALDKVIYLAPDHVAALMDRARSHEQQGRYREAAKDFAQALASLERRTPGVAVEGLEHHRAEDVLAHCAEGLERCQRRAAG